jgi:hypothetical protein
MAGVECLVCTRTHMQRCHSGIWDGGRWMGYRQSWTTDTVHCFWQTPWVSLSVQQSECCTTRQQQERGVICHTWRKERRRLRDIEPVQRLPVLISGRVAAHPVRSTALFLPQQPCSCHCMTFILTLENKFPFASNSTNIFVMLRKCRQVKKKYLKWNVHC